MTNSNYASNLKSVSYL